MSATARPLQAAADPAKEPQAMICRPLALLSLLALSACMTPRVHVQPSQAVLEARARQAAHRPTACPPGDLAAVSPVTIGFNFRESELTEPARGSLDRTAAWLGCHTEISAVILPQSDQRGTDEEQRNFAARRAQAVAGYLKSRGVPDIQLSIQPLGTDEPNGRHVIIRAVGQGW